MASTSSLLSRIAAKLGVSSGSPNLEKLLRQQAKQIERLRQEVARLQGLQEKAAKQEHRALAELSRKLTRFETAAVRRRKERTRIRHFIDLEEGLASARFVLERMPDLQPLQDRTELLVFALQQVSLEGLCLEFGVFQGQTIRTIAEHHPAPVHGFDSFEGLPEAGGVSLAGGQFDLSGELPEVPGNVTLHKGWFDETLPAFLERQDAPLAFLHIDCDLYSSTRTVLALLAPRMRTGTVIVFDEFLNFPSWRLHEVKALTEAAATYGWQYDYIGRSDSRQVAIRLTAVGTASADDDTSLTAAPEGGS